MKEDHHPSGFIRKVLSIQGVKATPKLVLVTLAEYSTWGKVEMSHKEVMALCHLEERQTRSVLKELVSLGYLNVLEAGNGRGKKTRYHINVTPYHPDQKVAISSTPLGCNYSEAIATFIERREKHHQSKLKGNGSVS